MSAAAEHVVNRRGANRRSHGLLGQWRAFRDAAQRPSLEILRAREETRRPRSIRRLSVRLASSPVRVAIEPGIRSKDLLFHGCSQQYELNNRRQIICFCSLFIHRNYLFSFFLLIKIKFYFYFISIYLYFQAFYLFFFK